MVLVALLYLTAAAGAPADGYDWRNDAKRLEIAEAFENFSLVCASDYGFRRPSALGPEQMSAKIKAHLLLSPDPNETMRRWASPMMRHHRAGDEEAIDKAAHRVVDAFEAAVADPDALDEAEKLYTAQYMGVLEGAMSACSDFASDPFIAKNYLTGSGSTDRFRAEVKRRFDKEFAEFKASHSK